MYTHPPPPVISFSCVWLDGEHRYQKKKKKEKKNRKETNANSISLSFRMERVCGNEESLYKKQFIWICTRLDLYNTYTKFTY